MIKKLTILTSIAISLSFQAISMDNKLTTDLSTTLKAAIGKLETTSEVLDQRRPLEENEKKGTSRNVRETRFMLENLEWKMTASKEGGKQEALYCEKLAVFQKLNQNAIAKLPPSFTPSAGEASMYLYTFVPRAVKKEDRDKAIKASDTVLDGVQELVKEIHNIKNALSTHDEDQCEEILFNLQDYTSKKFKGRPNRKLVVDFIWDIYDVLINFDILDHISSIEEKK